VRKLDFSLIFSVFFSASVEDPQCVTPKSRKNEYNQSHLAPPSASPGGHQSHEDFEMASPQWPRTPASPVCILCVCFTNEGRRLKVVFSLFDRYSTATFHRKRLGQLRLISRFTIFSYILLIIFILVPYFKPWSKNANLNLIWVELCTV
jgi:hypothetical protein